ncbi:hypothetical protein B0A48_02392 [Cryoendolithus antarcticus]|uniref:Rrn9 domain-containing protein n=1 Tax=Cryoendolithus antarcticus TaxID=1507870 RepID=A0A1V8TNU5_9PEZI|nr:hypothetical protein B0A48_02392 [Cryoendolithus antarcticus]
MAYSNDDSMFDEEEEWEDPAGFDGHWEEDFLSNDEVLPDAGTATNTQNPETDADGTDSVYEDDWSSEQTEFMDQHEGRTVGDDRPAPLDWQTDEDREAWQRAYNAAFPIVERMSTLELEHAYDRRLPESKIKVDNFGRLNELTASKYGVWPRSRLPDRRSRSLFEPRAKFQLPQKLPYSARDFPGRPEWLSMPTRDEYRYGDMDRDFVIDRERPGSVDSDAETHEQLLQYLIEEAETASALCAVAINEAEQQKKAGWWDSMIGNKAALSDNKRSAKLEGLRRDVQEAWEKVDEVYAAREARGEERLEAEREEDRRYEMSGGLGEVSEDDGSVFSQDRGVKRSRSSAESPERSSKRRRSTVTAMSRSTLRGVRRRKYRWR